MCQKHFSWRPNSAVRMRNPQNNSYYYSLVFDRQIYCESKVEGCIRNEVCIFKKIRVENNYALTAEIEQEENVMQIQQDTKYSLEIWRDSEIYKPNLIQLLYVINHYIIINWIQIFYYFENNAVLKIITVDEFYIFEILLKKY